MNKINNTETINELKSQHFRVNLTHYRKYGNVVMPTYLAKQLKESNVPILPPENNGGFTVGVVKRNGEKYVSVAKCHDVDPFNFRRGTQIVLSRIKDKINENATPF